MGCSKRPRRLAAGTRVHVRSEHFVAECDAVVTGATYDEGWLYRIDVVSGDRLDAHRNEKDELWVWDFELEPIRDQPHTHARVESFEATEFGLTRRVVRSDHPPYEQHCPLAALEQFAQTAEQLGREGFTCESLVRYERAAGRGARFREVKVALAFLTDCNLLDVRDRRYYSKTDRLGDDALREYLALV